MIRTQWAEPKNKKGNFRDALFDLLGPNITEHEIVTVARYFSAESCATGCNREIVRSTVHWELSRNLWDDLERLEEHLYHVLGDVFGSVSESVLFKAIRACRLPLKPSLIQNMLSVLVLRIHQWEFRLKFSGKFSDWRKIAVERSAFKNFFHSLMLRRTSVHRYNRLI